MQMSSKSTQIRVISMMRTVPLQCMNLQYSMTGKQINTALTLPKAKMSQMSLCKSMLRSEEGRSPWRHSLS